MFSKALKVVGLMGGGILTVGVGALGTHLVYPTLEKNFFPERINHEKKLNESVDNTKKEVDRLGADLLSQEELGIQRTQKFSHLNQKLEELNGQVADKQRELDKKQSDLSQKDSQLKKQKRIHGENQNKINTLNSQISGKDSEINKEVALKTRFEEQLNDRKHRLSLHKEDILKSQFHNWDLLDINLRKIEFKEFSSNNAEFIETDKSGKKTTFKVHKNETPLHETTAKHIRDNGIAFNVNTDSFNGWDKKIKVTRFDVDYSSKTICSEDKKKYEINTENRTITLSEYFNDEWAQEAFKVFIAIKTLEFFPLEYELDSSLDYLFKFSERASLPHNFYDSSTITLDKFKNSCPEKQICISTSRFITIEDFIRYWMLKTIEFVQTGKVDLTGFLNPVLKLKSYQ